MEMETDGISNYYIDRLIEQVSCKLINGGFSFSDLTTTLNKRCCRRRHI